MDDRISEASARLARTPKVLEALLDGLPEHLTGAHEGEGTWSPYDVIGHLIHGERTDWIPRARTILEHGSDKTFEPFDRFAQLEEGPVPLAEKLVTFRALREESLEALAAMDLGEDDLERRGVHPEFGTVTMGQLIATWVVHDLGHIAQIVRVIAKHDADAVGPWARYLGILGR